jgi:hypothetical protein
MTREESYHLILNNIDREQIVGMGFYNYVKYRDREDYTFPSMIMIAIRCDRIRLVRYLILKYPNSRSYTPQSGKLFIHVGTRRMIDTLWSLGYNPNDHLHTILHQAAYNKSPDVIRYLIRIQALQSISPEHILGIRQKGSPQIRKLLKVCLSRQS